MYDDIYRVPLIAKVPGLPAGRVEDAFATLTDLTPTFLELADVEPPEHYQGRSLLPLIAGERPDDWPTEVVAEFHGHHFPYPQRMIRTDRYKLVVNPADVNELYDLSTDPDEMHNRYDHPELAAVRRDLTTRLYDVLRERGDNFYHWMTSMFEVGGKNYDTALSALDQEASRS
jgi:arylsulfatase A-like enzyme